MNHKINVILPSIFGIIYPAQSHEETGAYPRRLRGNLKHVGNSISGHNHTHSHTTGNCIHTLQTTTDTDDNHLTEYVFGLGEENWNTQRTLQINKKNIQY